MALQPDASETLKDLGLVAGYARNIILNSTVMMTSAILHGVYLILTTSALVILATRKEGAKRARVGLGATVVILFSISTADLCCRTMSYMLVLNRLRNNFASNLAFKASQDSFDLTRYYTLVLISEALFAISVRRPPSSESSAPLDLALVRHWRRYRHLEGMGAFRREDENHVLTDYPAGGPHRRVNHSQVLPFH
ncbi:hypothetical protein PM082_000523 [Marasmius tenuissimus]|nr:hypothetical protein PM082_000523 [Marasmius tenuissimus]